MSGTKSCRVAVVAAAVAVSVAIAACGGGGHKSSSSTSSSRSAASATSPAQSSTTTTATTSTTAAAPLWSLPNATPEGTRDVVSQIDSSDVSKLKVAWKIPITGVKGLYGVFASTPVFGPNGVAYLQDLGDNVYAVNIKTGKQIWKYTVPASQANGEGPNGVTLVDGTVYGETSSQAFALQAATGEQQWKSAPLSTPKHGQGINIAPQVADGKVFVSTSGQQHGGVAYALDAKTGKILWSFQETKDPAQRTVGGLDGTGGAWGTPVVENGLVYFGIANPYRSIDDAFKHPNKLLYDDSTVALDANTGKLKWYYQGVPNDFHDWDMQIGPMYTASGPGGQPTVIDAGKMGYVYAMNASTGKLDWKTSVGHHNGQDNIATLALEHKAKESSIKLPYTFCPGVQGGVETQMAMADGVVYVPANNLCSAFTTKTGLVAEKLGNFTKGTGDFEALNLKTGKVTWDTKLPSSPYGAATVTNDLVFTTTFNGKLIAFNRNTGQIVWQQQLSAGTNAPVAIDGDTLVTVASYADGPGQTAEIVAYSLSPASGSTATATTGSAGTATSGSTGTPTATATATAAAGGSSGSPSAVALFVSSVAGQPLKHPVKKVGAGGP